jgi:hypothetical protein
MEHGEVERLDAPEIIGVENVLSADGGRRGRAEIGFEHLQDGLQRRHARHVQSLAGAFELLGELAVEQGVEDDSGGGLDIPHHPLELAPATHQGVQVLDRPDLGILNPDRLGDGDQRLAGRVGDHMQVKSSQDIHGHPLDNRDGLREQPR